jgi:hypothetical protein
MGASSAPPVQPFLQLLNGDGGAQSGSNKRRRRTDRDINNVLNAERPIRGRRSVTGAGPNGEALGALPLRERKEHLRALLSGRDSFLHFSDHQIGRGQAFYDRACGLLGSFTLPISMFRASGWSIA